MRVCSDLNITEIPHIWIEVHLLLRRGSLISSSRKRLMPTMDQRGLLALLYRRAGFGATMQELDRSMSVGFGGTVNGLISGLSQKVDIADSIALPKLTKPPYFVPKGSANLQAIKAFNRELSSEISDLRIWWIGRMMSTSVPLREKLTFFLHCHFPTAVSKVRFPYYMYRQNQIFRSMGPGNFTSLTSAVATDPAMLIWLDASTDRPPDPNENFARELMERFTMGLGSYSELDVRSAAFAFTGWHLDQKTGRFAINEKAHRPSSIPFLGHSKIATGQQVIDIVTHTEASARFVTASFWSRFVYPITTSDPIVIELANTYAKDRDLTNLLQAILLHPRFGSTQTATGLIKQPTEYVVGVLRALGVGVPELSDPKLALLPLMASMGQVLFDPPSVGGWPQNEYWLSTAAALARWRFASKLASTADISFVADSPIRSRLDAVSELLSVSSWTRSSAAALNKASKNPQILLSLALVSPEYVSN